MRKAILKKDKCQTAKKMKNSLTRKSKIVYSLTISVSFHLKNGECTLMFKSWLSRPFDPFKDLSVYVNFMISRCPFTQVVFDLKSDF